MGKTLRDSEDALLKKITVANYLQDPYYAPIMKAVEGLLREKGFVAPLELFIRMESREGHTLQFRQGQPNLAYFADARARSGSQALAHRVQTMDQGLLPPLAVFKDRRPKY